MSESLMKAWTACKCVVKAKCDYRRDFYKVLSRVCTDSCHNTSVLVLTTEVIVAGIGVGMSFSLSKLENAMPIGWLHIIKSGNVYER